MEGAFVDKVTPSLTNVSELAPPKFDIPVIVLIQPKAIEYAEEYIIIEPMDSRVLYVASSLRCRM